ncbi:MAG TPA: Asp-tRNA(Asn)/Glu-tRNA(Gln) amidotransferase subunit GatB [Candidatus Omnitrophica bacterium]|nr:MAG: asparaginyl/glutamyl-tRNA amidotransferase subunit C [Omnitrophica WOR_2 bacterium GWA2_45_18]OGX18628.1 MAG: asparaginyl/glutamyl-tRNA amidotransferase subunit C [Omnitrophica WOR_2 bacterium GWC2_45_7]HBR15496.1 Asp-tRNA(Asn)/Glu-tRNA(Gln) amidotransferase subunit GatB [Candidatus Omnitrophota bacterium]
MISEKDVRYIAGLSRIHLRDEEIESLTKDLENILHYVKKLEKLDIAHVNPTSHVLPLKNVYREDTITPSLQQSEALRISGETSKGSFKVPKVIE